MDRANKIVTEDDEKAMDKIYRIDGSQRRVIGIHSRRKFKNSYEYECSFTLGENVGMKNEKWIPMMTADNAWIPRSEILLRIKSRSPMSIRRKLLPAVSSDL